MGPVLPSDDPLARPSGHATSQHLVTGAGMEEARRVSLRVVHFFARRWWVLLIVTAGLLYAVRAYADSLPRVYGCSPVVIELVQEPPSNARSFEAYDYAAATLAYTVVPTQQAVLSTNQLLDLVVRDLGLEHDPDYSRLGGRVVTNAQEHTSLISLSVQGPEPEMNAKVANAIARRYQALRSEERSTFMMFLLTAAESMVSRRKEELKTAEQNIKEFREKNQVVDVGGAEDTIRRKLSDLFTLLKGTEDQRDRSVEAEAQVLAAERDGRDVGQVGVVREGAEVRAALAELHKLEQQTQALAMKETELSKDLASARKLLSDQQQTVKDLMRARAEDIKITANSSRKRADTLASEYAVAEKELTRIVGLRIEAAALEQAREEARRALASATDDSRSMDDIRAHKVEPVRIRQQAQVSTAVVSPKLSVIYLGGGILSLLVAIVVAFLFDLVSTRLRDPEEIQRIAGAPYLGVVPLFKPSKSASPGRRILEEVDGEASEAYRLLAATALLHAGTGEPPKTLLVTSPQAGEGKTTTAIGLSMALARRGRRVLLVDADLRKPTLHLVLATSPEPGLTTLFAVDRSVWDALRTLEIDVDGRGTVHLDVLTAGVLPPNPADLLSGPRMLAFLKDARSRYDVVVLDSPPVNPVSDACLLAPYVDAILIVIREGRTHRSPLHRAVSRLRGVRGALRGILVNGTRARRSEGYGYGYGYGYPPGGRTTGGRPKSASSTGAETSGAAAGSVAGNGAAANGRKNGAASASDSEEPKVTIRVSPVAARRSSSPEV